MGDFPIWGGSEVQGWTHVESEDMAQRIKAIQRAKGLKVKIRRKYETILGERMVRNPYSAKVYWKP